MLGVISTRAAFAVMALAALTPLSACSQQAPNPNDPHGWLGRPLCYAKYRITGADGLSDDQAHGLENDVARLSGRFAIMARDEAPQGDPPPLISQMVTDLTLEVGYMMPCAKIEATSGRLLDFIHRGMPPIKLPDGVRVRFVATATEVKLTDPMTPPKYGAGQ